MKVLTWFALPLAVFALTACSDQATEPDLDLTASYAKGGKPGKPTSDPAQPALAIDGGGLYVADEDGGNKTMIYDPGRYFNPSWFSDGEGTGADPYRILISAGISGQIPMEIVEVVVDNGVPRAGAITEVLPDPWYVHAEVSPTGSELVAVWVDQTYFHGELRLVDLQDLSVETVYQVPVDHELFRPEWSPDGTKIVFFESVNPFPQGTTIWILDRPTGELKEVLTFTSTTDSPRGVSWGRTSDQLVFDYDQTLYHVVLDENLDPVGAPVALGRGRGPVWSPDDTRIAYEYRNTTYIKTFPPGRKDKRVLGGWWPDWRR